MLEKHSTRNTASNRLSHSNCRTLVCVADFAGTETMPELVLNRVKLATAKSSSP
jgi:hypothetical protein